MKHRIGEMAGRIWTILGEKQDVDILKLPKILKGKGEIVCQAVGWLAREDKINYHTKERSLCRLIQPVLLLLRTLSVPQIP